MVKIKSEVYIFTSCCDQLAILEIGTFRFVVCSVTQVEICGILVTGGE